MTAQTLTITESNTKSFPLKKIKWVWTSTDAGVVTGVATTDHFSGEIVRLVTIPAAGGSAPTADYDIAINDEDNADVLMGGGADRSATATQQVLASSLGVCLNTKLTLEITNAGNAKGGTVILYIL